MTIIESSVSKLQKCLKPSTITIISKSLRPLFKNDDFQCLACDCISQISFLHHKVVFFIVLHFALILTSVHIFWLIFFLFTDCLWCLKWVKNKFLSEVQRAQIVLYMDKIYLNGKYLVKWGVVRQQCIKRLRSIKSMSSIPIKKELEDRELPLHEKTT